MNEYSPQQHCPNRLCVNHRKTTEEAVAPHNKERNRLRCRACGRTWVTHYRSFHYRLKTPVTKVNRALDLLNAGFAIRQVAELVKVSPGTVLRWKHKTKSSTTQR